MKKIINILLLLSFGVLLSSCFTSKDSIEDAKKDMGIIENKSVEDAKKDMGIVENGTGNTAKDVIAEPVDTEPEKKSEPKIKINSITKKQFLEIDDLSKQNLLDGEVEITGKTNVIVDKIIVNFKNDESEFPDDSYQLKQFSAGDDTFLYRAFSRYETLDFGKNTYVFEAYSGDEVAKLELVINVVKEEEKKIEEKIEEVYEDLSITTLPTGSSFGTPVDLGNGKISYSDIKGLEIKKDVTPDLSCETVTEQLATKISSWYFWNTCRPISEDEGLSFYVVRLNGEEYVYEKHYYLPYQGIYGIQELEVGTGVTNKNIGTANAELKARNDEFNITEVTDNLFVEISK